MSEFKFACPICGQHMNADSKDSGSQISCPTCYRKIVVPQAPATTETKFVISASEANKPRPTSTTVPPLEPIQRAPEKSIVPIVLVVLLVLGVGAGAAVFAMRGRGHSKPQSEEAADGAPSSTKPEVPAQPEYTGTNRWSLDLANAEFPDEPVSGSIHHRAFTLEHASLTGSNLTLRVGRTGSIELGLNVYFFNRQAEELSGKSAAVKPSDTPAPRVVLRWLEAKRESQTFRSGYAMKVEFGAITNNALPGKIFLCTPDANQSWVAGTFNAEIRKPNPPRPRGPAQR